MSKRRGRWHAPSSRHLRALLSVCGRCSFKGLGCCSCRVCVCVGVGGVVLWRCVCVWPVDPTCRIRIHVFLGRSHKNTSDILRVNPNPKIPNPGSFVVDTHQPPRRCSPPLSPQTHWLRPQDPASKKAGGTQVIFYSSNLELYAAIPNSVLCWDDDTVNLIFLRVRVRVKEFLNRSFVHSKAFLH